jgi:lipopolysaccharide heptosyltransferase II
MAYNYKNILVVKICCIGDVVFLTPAIQALHSAFPDARISFMASRWIKEVVERIPYVDEIVYFDAPLYRKKIAGAKETLQVISLLRKKKFDLAVFGHRTSVFPFVGMLAGIKERIGFTGAKFLTGSTPFDPQQHETDRYLSIIRLVADCDREIRTLLVAKEKDNISADAICKKIGFESNGKYIGVFPGGGENPGTSMHIKRWYVEDYAELCKQLFVKKGLVPLFLGNASDKLVVEKIQAILPKNIPAVNAGGLTNLGGLCGLFKKCRVVIGGDTGPLHMAAALDVPTVTLFGPSDPRLVAPREAKHRYVWQSVYCSPCYTPVSVLDKKNRKGDEFICRTGTHECMKDMKVEIVLKAVMDVI